MKAFVLASYTLGLGEVAVSGDTNALLTYGPLGIITAWLMYRDERRALLLREIELSNSKYHGDILHRIDGLTKALLADMLDRNPSSKVRHYAEKTIAKIEARTPANGD